MSTNYTQLSLSYIYFYKIIQSHNFYLKIYENHLLVNEAKFHFPEYYNYHYPKQNIETLRQRLTYSTIC